MTEPATPPENTPQIDPTSVAPGGDPGAAVKLFETPEDNLGEPASGALATPETPVSAPQTPQTPQTPEAGTTPPATPELKLEDVRIKEVADLSDPEKKLLQDNAAT
jgi:hypothetical protein